MTRVSAWTGLQTKKSLKLLHKYHGTLKPLHSSLITDNKIINILERLFCSCNGVSYRHEQRKHTKNPHTNMTPHTVTHD